MVLMDLKQGGTAHRYLALMVLLILIYIVGLVVISLLQQSTDAQERYESAHLQLQKYQAISASKSQVQTDNETLKQLNNEDSRYLYANSQSLAQAKLQKKLQQVIQSSGASLVSMQAIKSSAETDFLPITMKLHLRLSHQVLMKLIYQLESQNPVGFVYKLHIQRSTRTMRTQQISTDETLLDARLEYTVFMVEAYVS